MPTWPCTSLPNRPVSEAQSSLRGGSGCLVCPHSNYAEPCISLVGHRVWNSLPRELHLFPRSRLSLSLSLSLSFSFSLPPSLSVSLSLFLSVSASVSVSVSVSLCLCLSLSVCLSVCVCVCVC